ncbi:hypothetical protein IEQ34_003462 [Dendrobium chrysotoxum]|uniref:Uncharacterized protein n=1 Tax=Dendrobium chrysotoxum TaxID=161865 RepID=A0AAV7HJP5_DENCH|nr:hypothetical protein IEQ34_003462 [Dendrobium chrysotoxum]
MHASHKRKKTIGRPFGFTFPQYYKNPSRTHIFQPINFISPGPFRKLPHPCVILPAAAICRFTSAPTHLHLLPISYFSIPTVPKPLAAQSRWPCRTHLYLEPNASLLITAFAFYSLTQNCFSLISLSPNATRHPSRLNHQITGRVEISIAFHMGSPEIYNHISWIDSSKNQKIVNKRKMNTQEFLEEEKFDSNMKNTKLSIEERK